MRSFVKKFLKFKTLPHFSAIVAVALLSGCGVLGGSGSTPNPANSPNSLGDGGNPGPQGATSTDRSDRRDDDLRPEFSEFNTNLGSSTSRVGGSSASNTPGAVDGEILPATTFALPGGAVEPNQPAPGPDPDGQFKALQGSLIDRDLTNIFPPQEPGSSFEPDPGKFPGIVTRPGSSFGSCTGADCF